VVFVGMMGAGVPCARTKSDAHQKYPNIPITKSKPPMTRQTIGTAIAARSAASILCGTYNATTAGTKSVNRPVFIALEAVLIAAYMVLRAAVSRCISC
jgi:hypothetical protein